MESKKLITCFEYIYKRVSENPRMLESELYEVIINSNFFAELGYETFGKDVRAQRRVPDTGKLADYVTYDDYGNAIFALEAKPPSHKTLSDALPQLWNRYVLPLNSQYGVLTNGWSLIIYRKIGTKSDKIITFNIGDASQEICNKIFQLLKKPIYDFTIYSRVEEYFTKVEKLSLKEDLAKENFFAVFKLDKSSVFGLLVSNLADLFDWVHPRSKFLKGAYGFWKKSLATEPNKIPDSWKPFLKTDQDIFKLMFCIETAHALLARLILAKACEDLNFPGISISNFILQKIHQARGNIPLISYPIILERLIKEMRDKLVFSIFEEDIFSWWTDAFKDYKEKSSVELLRLEVDTPLEDFGSIIAKIILVIYKFDFKEVAGDPLGDLYQHYFDRDTRKALGEFYTPVEVVNYMLDSVGYNNIGQKRLLDPACGSGTFIVEALKRYLKEANIRAAQDGWAHILRELCNSPKIVGFDIHPFACLIARTRFMLELIPYFKKAVEEEAPKFFNLHRIPIFRTDSLEIEMLPPEYVKQTKFYENMGEDIVFPVTLPMKIDNESEISVKIILPSWRKIISHGILLFNLGEYFCTLQALFDAIKERLDWGEEGKEVILESTLQMHLKNYLRDKDFELIANFFRSYAQHIINETNQIKSEFQNGRLIKTIEDKVLASLLKNYFQYDFVLGNPPYVKIESIQEEKREQYKKLYESALYRFDLYMLFIEKGVKWLNSGGMFGYIISNMFIKRDSGRALREFILSNSSIIQFINFGDSGVFSEVTNYPAIIILKKGSIAKNKIKVVRVKKPKKDILQEIAEKIRLDEYLGEYYDIFSTDQNILSSAQWKFIPKIESKIMDKLENGSDLLESIVHVRRGLVTGANPVFITKDISEYEENLLRPIISGRNIEKWNIYWDGSFIIYPHISRKNSVDINSFPKIYEYLSSHRSKLEQRYCVKRKNPRKWYELHDSCDPDWFARPKIVVGGISNKNEFAIDESGNFYCLDSSFFIVQKLTSKINLRYLLGLLNSKPLEFYFKHIASVKRGKYYEYRSQYLDLLPIKIPNNPFEKNVETMIIKKVEQIIQFSENRRFIKSFPDKYLDEYRSKGVEFDEFKSKIKMNHNVLNPFSSSFPRKGFNVFPDKDEDSIWVDTNEKAQYLVLALVNRKVKQDETIKILIPRNNLIVKEILDKLKKTDEKIKSKPLEHHEEELNDLVYQLYGLDEKDLEVIEKFLAFA